MSLAVHRLYNHTCHRLRRPYRHSIIQTPTLVSRSCFDYSVTNNLILDVDFPSPTFMDFQENGRLPGLIRGTA
ncbi:hypothetical protein BDR05DRAFT_958882 [Suillus weaverae]|nr:hypothetical protein BDR05DRAFT_958882 [Suillus weaverae]